MKYSESSVKKYGLNQGYRSLVRTSLVIYESPACGQDQTDRQKNIEPEIFAGSSEIRIKDLAEAIHYRSLNKQGWVGL